MKVETVKSQVTATIFLEENEIGFLRTAIARYLDKHPNSGTGFSDELLAHLDNIHTPNYNLQYPMGRCR